LDRVQLTVLGVYGLALETRGKFEIDLESLKPYGGKRRNRSCEFA